MKRLLFFVALTGLMGWGLRAQDTLRTFTFAANDMTGISYGASAVCQYGDTIGGEAVSPHYWGSYAYSYWNRIEDSASTFNYTSRYPYLMSAGWLNYIATRMGSEQVGNDNGYMLMSMLDYNYDHYSTDYGNCFNAYIAFPAVTLPTTTQVVEVRWTQFYRKYYDQCFVDYKVNGAWETMEVNVTGIDVAINNYGATHPSYTLPLAAAQGGSVELRLRYYSYGRGAAYGYCWAVDNVAIVSGNPNQWLSAPEHFVDGNYNEIPQGMQIPLTWYRGMRNTGANTQTGVNVNFQHIGPTGSTSNFISESFSNMAPSSEYDTLVVNPRGFYNAENPGWLDLGPNYGQSSIGNITNTGLPTTTAGLNRYTATVGSASLTAAGDTHSYYVTTADSDGTFAWGFGNGVLAGGSNGFYYGYTSDGYITSDPDGSSFRNNNHRVLVRLTTGNTLPTDSAGHPWVFRGVEMVVDPYFAESAIGTHITPMLWRVETNAEGNVNFPGVSTGVTGYVVDSTDVTPMADTGYLLPGQYNTMRIMFPEQPVLEPNTSYLIGYRLDEDADFALAANNNRYYHYVNGERISVLFANDEVLEPYSHFATPDNYDVAVYATGNYSGYIWGGLNIGEYPMISALVGPEVYMPKVAVNITANNSEVYGDLHGYVYGSDSVIVGLSSGYTMRAQEGYRITDVLVDGVSVLDECSSWEENRYITDTLGNFVELFNHTVYYYEFDSIIANHTLTVLTTPLSQHTVTVGCDTIVHIYNIFENGQEDLYGTDYFCGTHSYYNTYVPFYFSVEEDYKIDYIVVDGDTNYMEGTVQYYHFTLDMNNTNHTISASGSVIPITTITTINEGNGYIYSENTETRLYDTTSITIPQGNSLRLGFASFAPGSEYYGVLSDSNTAMLTHLYVDGVELNLNGDDGNNFSLTIYDYIDYYGYLSYNLTVYADTSDHTIRAVFGPWVEPCRAPNYINAYEEYTDVVFQWNSRSSIQRYVVEIEQHAWDENSESYIPTGNIYTHYASGDSTRLRVPGLAADFYYAYTVTAICDTTDGTSASSQTYYFYKRPTHTITLINNGGGYMIENYNFTSLRDTVVQTMLEGNYRTYIFYTLNPAHSNFASYGVDTNAAQLTHLYVDGEEIPLTDGRLDIYDNLESEGSIAYLLSVYAYADQTIEAVFGPYGSGCTPVRNLNYDNSADTAVTVTWTEPVSGPQSYSVNFIEYDGEYDSIIREETFQTDSTFITIPGIQPRHDYIVTVAINCTDSMIVSNSIYFYQPAYHYITLINNGGGYMRDNNGNSVSDTMVIRAEEGEYFQISLGSFSPENNYYNIDSNALQLTNLRIDGNEIALSNATDGLSMDNYGDEIYYYYYLYPYSDVIIEAVYGPWGSLCQPISSLYLNEVNDSNAEIRWYDYNYGNHAAHVLNLIDLSTSDTTVYILEPNYYRTFTISNLVPGTNYKVDLYAACDSTSLSLPVNTYFTMPLVVPLTFSNPDQGQMYYGDNYQWISSDTTTITVSSNTTFIMYSDRPGGEYYGIDVDTSVAHLTHLWFDGIDIATDIPGYYDFSGCELEVVNHTEGYIQYTLNVYADTAHTVIARFGSWDDTVDVVYNDITFTCSGDGNGTVFENSPSENLCGETVQVRQGFLASYNFLPATGSSLTHLYVNNVDRISETTTHTTANSITYQSLSFMPDTGSVVMPVFERNTYLVTLLVNDPAMGSVSGAGRYYYDSVATLTATPNDGYRFLAWSDGDSNAIRQIVVTADITLTASFEALPPMPIDTFTVTLTMNDTAMGSVSGAGRYAEGDTVVISATANEGYHFVRWSDDDTLATRTLIVDADLTLTAFFEADSTTGIAHVEAVSVNVYTDGMQIIAQGAQSDETVTLFSVDGRRIDARRCTGGDVRFEVSVSGLYLVRFADGAVRRVVVVR